MSEKFVADSAETMSKPFLLEHVMNKKKFYHQWSNDDESTIAQNCLFGVETPYTA